MHGAGKLEWSAGLALKAKIASIRLALRCIHLTTCVAELNNTIVIHENVLFYHPFQCDKLRTTQMHIQTQIYQLQNQLEEKTMQLNAARLQHQQLYAEYQFSQQWLQENDILVRREKQKALIVMLSLPTRLLTYEQLDKLQQVLTRNYTYQGK